MGAISHESGWDLKWNPAGSGSILDPRMPIPDIQSDPRQPKKRPDTEQKAKSIYQDIMKRCYVVVQLTVDLIQLNYWLISKGRYQLKISV